MEDYQAFMAQNLLSRSRDKPEGSTINLLCLVGPDGTFSDGRIMKAEWLDEAVGRRLRGKNVLSEGCAEVIDILKEKGYFVKEEEISHRYPYDWRTNNPVIVT